MVDLIAPNRRIVARRSLTILVASLLLQALVAANADPFAFFGPSITVSRADRQRLDRGEPIARVLRAGDHEVAVFAAVRVAIDGDRLVAWIRRIEALKTSAYVLAIHRFSDPPVMEDLAGLVLDDEDLSEIRACRPGKCGLKLSAIEITQLQHTAAEAGVDWKPAVQEAVRRVILQRVKAYLAEGDAALPPYENHDGQTWPAATFASILDHSEFLTEHRPQFAEHLRQYPKTPAPEVESFLYWSKERVAGKAIISATHVSILRSADAGVPDALVAGKGLFATHYVNGSLGMTAIVRGESGAFNYLVYLNRSAVDLLGGRLGGLVRWFMQRRLKAEAAEVLVGLRRRLESGAP